MEWDDREVTPRRVKFNPRRMEGEEEAQPPPAAADGGSSADQWQTQATAPVSKPTIGVTTTSCKPNHGATTTASRPMPGPSRVRHREESAEESDRHRTVAVFHRLGRSKPTAPARSPNRYPDLRERPTRGMLFGGLRPVPRYQLDPLPGACFNCRRRGHSRAACHEPRTIFCYNCGRQDTTLRDFPRCGEVHQEYLRRQDSLRRVETSSRESPRAPRRREASPPSTTQQRASRRDQSSSPESKTLTSSRTGPTTTSATPSSRPDDPDHIDAPGSSHAIRVTPTTPSRWSTFPPTNPSWWSTFPPSATCPGTCKRRYLGHSWPRRNR